eukprot:m.118482 g.118482  ORF g.118482 m.118482 type:complete len:325 (-) comp16433_c0_seq3:1704-2678(-)
MLRDPMRGARCDEPYIFVKVSHSLRFALRQPPPRPPQILRRRQLADMSDPCVDLPPEVFALVLSLLDARTLSRCRRVSRQWQRAAEDATLWRDLCIRLWADKAYVSPLARQQCDVQPMRAYLESVKDAARSWITEAELCSFAWSFRFKASAGEHFTADDPWWSGHSATTVRFLPDHTLQGCSDDNAGRTLQEGDYQWQFVEKAGLDPDGAEAPPGSCVRVNNFPVYVVFRHKWGFAMQSCWALWTSFPMPRRGEDLELEREARRFGVQLQAAEALRYNLGLHGADVELSHEALQLMLQQMEGDPVDDHEHYGDDFFDDDGSGLL